MAKITLFAQIIQKIPRDIVKQIIKEYDTDKHAKEFNSWSHLVSMVFCQLANCVSLREISNGLKSATGNLNHLGITRAPSKSNLAYQNEQRSSDMFKECYYRLLEYFGQQAAFPRRKFRIKAPVKLLDSTLVSLCLNTFTKIDLQKWLDEPFSPPPDESEPNVGVSALFVSVVQPSN